MRSEVGDMICCERIQVAVTPRTQILPDILCKKTLPRKRTRTRRHPSKNTADDGSSEQGLKEPSPNTVGICICYFLLPLSLMRRQPCGAAARLLGVPSCDGEACNRYKSDQSPIDSNCKVLFGVVDPDATIHQNYWRSYAPCIRSCEYNTSIRRNLTTHENFLLLPLIL